MMGEMGDVIDTYVSQATDTSNIGAIWHKDVLEEKPVQLIHAEIQNAEGKTAVSLSCDEDFYVELTYNVREKVPGLLGFMTITRVKDQIIPLTLRTDDFKENRYELLPKGESKVRLHFPKRLLGHGEYTISINLNSQFSNVWTLDTVKDCLKFELYDYITKRGNNRTGVLSTLIDWEIM